MSEFFPWTRKVRQQKHAQTIKYQLATESKQKNSVENGHQKLKCSNETNIQQINTQFVTQMGHQKLFASFACNSNLALIVQHLFVFSSLSL